MTATRTTHTKLTFYQAEGGLRGIPRRVGPDTSEGGVLVENLPGAGVYTGKRVSLAFGSAGSGNTLPGPEFPISSDRGQHGDSAVSGGARPGSRAQSALSEAQSPGSTRGISVPNLPKLPETAWVLSPPFAHLFKGPFPTGHPAPAPFGRLLLRKSLPGRRGSSGDAGL